MPNNPDQAALDAAVVENMNSFHVAIDKGYLSNLVCNIRNRYYSNASEMFTANEVRQLVEGFTAEVVTARQSADRVSELEKALRTIVRQIFGGNPVGHDAALAARRALKRWDACHNVTPEE